MTPIFQSKKEKDLFEQFQTADEKIREKTKNLLPGIKKSLNLSYENIVFLVIAFVMSCVIFFTLGVEKGRRDVGYVKDKGETRSSQGSQEAFRQSLPPVTKSRDLRRIEAKEVKAQETSRDREGEYYTVQLAAFRSKEAADRERAELKKNGYNAGIRISGDYYQLFIDGIKTKKDAQTIVNKLKNKYNDCYVKK
jgi:cell division protein FtsN